MQVYCTVGLFERLAQNVSSALAACRYETRFARGDYTVDLTLSHLLSVHPHTRREESVENDKRPSETDRL